MNEKAPKKNEGMQLEETQHIQRGQTQTHSNLAVSRALNARQSVS